MNKEGLAVIALRCILQRSEGEIRKSLDSTDNPLEVLKAYSNSGYESLLISAKQLVADWQNQGIDVYTVFSDSYPVQLRDVHDYPPVVFSKGILTKSRDNAVAVVGSRDINQGTFKSTMEVATTLAENGYTIVAGLARGVDTAAHKAALNAGTRTVAVVATGLNQVYPPENRILEHQLLRNGGLVLSQFAPNTPIRKFNFPMRNAVMSAYSRATVVMAASEKSGTRHQVRAAIRHGRPVILTSQVTENTSWGKEYVENPLIDVHLATSPKEILEMLGEVTNVPEPLRCLAL